MDTKRLTIFLTFFSFSMAAFSAKADWFQSLSEDIRDKYEELKEDAEEPYGYDL